MTEESKKQLGWAIKAFIGALGIIGALLVWIYNSLDTTLVEIKTALNELRCEVYDNQVCGIQERAILGNRITSIEVKIAKLP